MTAIANPTEALLQVVSDNIDAANAIALEAKAALGNSAKQIKDYREDTETTDDVVKEFQRKQGMLLAKLEEITVEINNHIRGILGTATWSEETTEAKRKAYKEHKSTATEAFKAVKSMYSILGMPEPEMPELLTFTGAAKSGATGTGTRRLRFDRVEVNGEVVKNLSAVAQKIKSASGATVSAKDLQSALFAAANTEDMDEIAALGDVSFQWTETDKDSVTHTFDITVYKSVESDDAEDESDDDADESDDTE